MNHLDLINCVHSAVPPGRTLSRQDFQLALDVARNVLVAYDAEHHGLAAGRDEVNAALYGAATHGALVAVPAETIKRWQLAILYHGSDQMMKMVVQEMNDLRRRRRR